jgi:hypothetical protein
LFGQQELNEEMTMRKILLGIAGAIAVLAVDGAGGDAQVQAQVSTSRNPWCLRDGPMGRGSWDCSYQTLQQCRISSNNDSDGFCTRNPNYRGPSRR